MHGKNINFFDLIYEACYLTEIFTCREINAANFNMEMAFDYFAMELDCSPKKFIRPPEKTIEELLDLGFLYYNSIRKNNKGQIDYISFNVDIVVPDSKYVINCLNYVKLYAVKQMDDKNKWVYRLYLDLSMIFMNGMDQMEHRYDFSQLGFYGYILVAEAYDGQLAEEIESSIDLYWEYMADKVPSDDVRFDIWLNKIEMATNSNKLSWFKRNDSYVTQYEENPIRLNLNQEDNRQIEEIYTTEDIKYPIHQFSIRISKERALTFILGDDDSKKNRLFVLAQQIVQSIERMETLIQEPELPEKKIEFTDVMVVSSSMYCKSKDHDIVPYRGIVKILTADDVEEDYDIYVGYCSKCETYTVFTLDYNKMLEKGRPLCMVYRYNEIKEEIHSEFTYISQSVLAAKGYNVQANSSLSETERQNILKECLDKNLVQIHDLLDFLNWLVRTREPLPRYKNAISKWKKDIDFVEEYKKEERDYAIVSSITVK